MILFLHFIFLIIILFDGRRRKQSYYIRHSFYYHAISNLQRYLYPSISPTRVKECSFGQIRWYSHQTWRTKGGLSWVPKVKICQNRLNIKASVCYGEIIFQRQNDGNLFNPQRRQHLWYQSFSIQDFLSIYSPNENNDLHIALLFFVCLPSQTDNKNLSISRAIDINSITNLR